MDLTRGSRRSPVRVVSRVDLRPAPSLLRGDVQGESEERRRDPRSASDCAAGRQRNDGPHLTRRQYQEQLACWEIPPTTRSSAAGFQLVWIAPGQPRGTGTRHIREYQDPESFGPEYRGWRNYPSAHG